LADPSFALASDYVITLCGLPLRSPPPAPPRLAIYSVHVLVCVHVPQYGGQALVVNFNKTCTAHQSRLQRETMQVSSADYTEGSLFQYLSQILQWTALHWASERGHRETVQLLLERGADPNRLDWVRVVYI